MTKTLTEQWRDGMLPDGYYYITSKKWGMLIDRYRDQINDCGHKWRGFDNCQGVVEEVLAPVPSYEEWQSCEKCADMLIDVNKKWRKTIKENKRLQEQKKKVIALIKDGRFVEALQELEK